MTPNLAATPDFLSIHVRTPRARFAWQELAGTPATPKIKETLGMSPNAKLSWGTIQTETTTPLLPSKQGTKRPHCTSPPSSPSSSRSKRVAENVQKFKEVMASATMANLALADRGPRRKNALARHRTEIGRPTTGRDSATFAGAQSVERPHSPDTTTAANGPSPRSGQGIPNSTATAAITGAKTNTAAQPPAPTVFITQN
ncbi:DNA replication endonuclease-helicase Dna2 [Sporothrix epigloea]|uniref:DNA replication endonuclease-helicase Dna2 n=1 Tax=Sporothrix epigloea TaxID=1892477 RepID=A0ABP0DU01_9PEZI